MPFEIETEMDIASMEARSNFSKATNGAARPEVLNVADLLALVVRPPSMLVDGLIPAAGATLMFGAPKSNKTLLAVQIGIAVASGHALCDQYRVIESGAVLMLEQDDPAGPASVQGILKCSQVPVEGIPFHLAPRVPFTFGLHFIEWLESDIVERSIRLVILDSYTALRGPRGSGVDIVKAEQQDLTVIDELAKRVNCAIVIIHHASKGSVGLNWSDQAAGTFAMSMDGSASSCITVRGSGQ